jgi:GNAT superfamily N-acetyltransferase
MVTIRAACADDAATVADIRAQSWRAAYLGLIPAGILAGATSPDTVAAHVDGIRRRGPAGILIAETAVGPAPAGGRAKAVGYANFGPERGADGRPGLAPGPGQRQARAELYAIYLDQAQWSTGAGRALLDAVLGRAVAAGYASVSLWVLEENSRARRFYQRAGFSATGESQVLDDLGGVTEIRYERPLR